MRRTIGSASRKQNKRKIEAEQVPAAAALRRNTKANTAVPFPLGSARIRICVLLSPPLPPSSSPSRGERGTSPAPKALHPAHWLRASLRFFSTPTTTKTKKQTKIFPHRPSIKAGPHMTGSAVQRGTAIIFGEGEKLMNF